MFNKSTEYNEIYAEMLLNGILEKTASFQCFDENMLTYGIVKKELLFEFTIMAEDSFLAKMKVIDLMNMKRVKFFQSRIFTANDKEYLGGKSWSRNRAK